MTLPGSVARLEADNLSASPVIVGDRLVGASEIDPKYPERDAEIWSSPAPFAVHDAVSDLEVGRLSTELFSHTLPSTAKGESPFIIHVRKLPKTAQCESIGNAALTVAGAE